MAQFDTSEFKRSHGKEPRGRGCWAFMPMCENSGAVGDPSSWLFSTFMTFSEAKRWAEDQSPETKKFSVGP